MRIALERAGYDDIPRNGLYVIGALAHAETSLHDIVRALRVSKQAAGRPSRAWVARLGPSPYSSGRRGPRARCLVPGFDGALFGRQWKDALWARYSTGAPARQRQSVEQYKIVKRA